MLATFLRRALLVGSLVFTPLATSACYAEAVAEPGYADGYYPEYYDGYVVYYDGVGRPYYYANGGVFWVSPGSPYYGHLVAHWHAYGPAYGRWYVNRGYRYRAYRRR